jgi:hypothetical protein
LIAKVRRISEIKKEMMKYLKVDFRFHILLAFLPKNTSLPPIIYQKDFVQRAEATGDVLAYSLLEQF